MSLDVFLRDSYWHLLCHASELPRPGDFLKLRWINRDVVVASDQGELLVFDNLCPHRGFKFFEKDFGNAPISCKYHGWSYHNGNLHIPCRQKFISAELLNITVTTYKSAWCGDFLFVAPNPICTLEEQLGDLFQSIASVSMDIAGRHSWNSYTYECDWKIAIENGLDSLHTPFVHKNTLNRLCLSDPTNSFSGLNSVAKFGIYDGSVLRRLKSIGRLFTPAERFEGYISIYLFPFTMLTSTFGYSYSLQNFFPSESDKRTHFYSRLLRGHIRAGLDSSVLDSFFDAAADMNKSVFEEDSIICKGIEFDKYSFHDLTRLSSDEEKIVHFRKNLQAISINFSNRDCGP